MPKSAIFLPDMENVDLENEDVKAFVAAVKLACSDSNGNTITELISAGRTKVRRGIEPR
jgi:hypothetical protein